MIKMRRMKEIVQPQETERVDKYSIDSKKDCAEIWTINYLLDLIYNIFCLPTSDGDGAGVLTL